MNLCNRWFWPHFARGDAMSLYKRGSACIERKDSFGALEAYTAAIESTDVPDNVKAIAHLQLAMDLPVPLHSTKLAARRRVERLWNRCDAAVRQAGHSTA